MDSNSHGNVVVVVVVSRTAPRAPTVKAPDFEKPLRGDKIARNAFCLKLACFLYATEALV